MQSAKFTIQVKHLHKLNAENSLFFIVQYILFLYYIFIFDIILSFIYILHLTI